MPSVFTLEGPSSTRTVQGSLGGDNALVSWLKTKNPMVAGGVAIGLALVVGFVVSQAAVFGLEKFRK